MAKNLTTIFIPDETLLRLDVHILSIEYLENRAPYFIEVTRHNNIGLDHKVVENEDGKKDGEEAITNSEEEASKKKAQCKAKKDMAQALLLVAMPELSAPTSTSMLVSGLSTIVPRLSTTMSRLSTTILGLSIAVLELSATMPRFFVFVFGLSALVSAFVLIFGLFVFILLFASVIVFLRLSPLPFPVLSLPKIPKPNLVVERQKLDDIISGWSRRSKKASSEELWSERI